MPFFVFNNILALIVLFFVFFGPGFSPVPGLLRFSSRPAACARQCVRQMTTIIGYHVSPGLSSEKCAVKNARRVHGAENGSSASKEFGWGRRLQM
jgi:hypothetical protein